MNHIERLIEEMCPDGVPFIPVSKAFIQPKVPKGLRRSQYEASGPYPIIDQGRKEICGYTRRGDHLISDGPHIIFGDHTRSIKYTPKTYALGADGTKVLSPRNGVEPRFAFHYLKSLKITDRGYNRHWPILKEMPFPIPPVEVQREIVAILDKFSRLEAELEAELEARLTQFHALLGATFETLIDQHPSLELGGVCYISSGSVFPQAHQGNADPNLTPFFKVSDMNHPSNVDSMRVAANYIDEKTRDLLRAKIIPAGSTIFPKVGAAIGTNKKRLTTSAAIVDNNIMTLTPHTSLLPDYLYFWMLTRDLREYSHDSGAVPSIRKSTMEHIAIPVPRREIQIEISNKLRTLSDVCHSLESGLPAEIAARRQQYEYYRDRLLTFKELQ